MTLPVQKPIFQSPPPEYSPDYLRQLIRALDGFFTQLNAAGSIQATTLNLSQVPGHSDTLLRIGDVFMVDGFLKLYPADNSSGGGGGTGNAILSGAAAPTSGVGSDGDVYFKTSSPVTFYGPKSGTTWPAGIVLEGTDGETLPGTTIISGTAAPLNSQGNDGDFYFKTTDPVTFYGPKAGGAWPAGVSLKGADGGGTGTPTQGATIISGTTAPNNAQGNNGDYYFKTTDPVTFYGPKASGVWPAGVSLKGNTGNPGADGRTILSGAGAPAVGIGNVGDFYIDTVAPKTLYGPKTVVGWGTGFVLKGDKGDPGADGTSTGGGGTGGGNFLGGCMMQRRTDSLTFSQAFQAYPVAWNTRIYDTGYWSDGSPARLTVPTGVKKVRLHCALNVLGQNGLDNTSAKIKMYVTKNGLTEYLGMLERHIETSETNGLQVRTISASSPPIPVNAGDYFEFGIFVGTPSVTFTMGEMSYLAIETVEVV